MNNLPITTLFERNGGIMAKLPDRAIDTWIELAETIRCALKGPDAAEVVPQIEIALTKKIAKLTPMELSEVAMLCLFTISKIADGKATVPSGEVKSAVVSSRAVEKAINESSAKYNMDIYDIGIHMVEQPTFMPKPEDMIKAAMSDDLANLDPVGSC
jgi:hypothetical protein